MRPAENSAESAVSVAAAGKTVAMLRKLMGIFRSPRAAAEKQQGDVHALDRSGDPRGGVQSDAYRHAEPVEVVEDAGVAMGGPGGTPQDDSTPDERREADRS